MRIKKKPTEVCFLANVWISSSGGNRRRIQLNYDWLPAEMINPAQAEFTEVIIENDQHIVSWE